MNQIRLRITTLCSFLCLVTGVSQAGVLYSTSFENPPFTIGNIAGQDGWNVFNAGGSNVSSISAVVDKTGTQSVFVNGGTSQSGPYHADTSTGPLLDLSADILIFTGTNQTGWQFAATGPGLSGYIGGIDISSTGTSSSFQAITSGFPVIGTFARSTSFTAPVWHHIDLLLNIPAQTYNITFDGSLLASSVPFCGDNGTCAGATVPTYADGFFDSFGVTGGGNDSGYMDNYLVQTVSSVPEPAAVSLVTLGLLAVGARIRRR